ncbi:MAG: hypothetical protein K0R44_7 [Thermomicrobiales bacterium]|jgi:hypothetical protein|nr:hypothetical protein [Thermomicrobiales bacterium]MDF3014782.1 hypothetical protein [Thermomicrobiales bacterium]
MSAEERAADVIRSADGNPDVYRHAARALADAELLVTDEIQAVLDAFVALRSDGSTLAYHRAGRALDAYLASRPS